MKALVLGKMGQLARELARAQWPSGCSRILPIGQPSIFAAPAQAAAARIQRAPDLVINAAAYTAADKAESELGSGPIKFLAG